MSVKLVVLMVLCCLWIDSYGETDEVSNENKALNTKHEEPFLIRAFGGMLELPNEVYFDSLSLLRGDVRFRNLGVLDGVDLPEFYLAIRVGVIDEPTIRQMEGMDSRFSCYGFNQAVETLKIADGRLVTSTILYDDEIFVSVLVDDPDVWINMLRRFSIKHDDPDASCLRAE